MLKISDEAQQISKRFFYAIQALKTEGKIRGLKTFTRRYDINYGNMNTLKNNIAKRSLKSEYIAVLARDYGISCEWVLLGKGDMKTCK